MIYWCFCSQQVSSRWFPSGLLTIYILPSILLGSSLCFKLDELSLSVCDQTNYIPPLIRFLPERNQPNLVWTLSNICPSTFVSSSPT